MTRDKKRAGYKAAQRLKRGAYRIAKGFSGTIFPDGISCNVCLEELAVENRYGLCAKCLDELPYVGEKFCLSCGVPLEDEADYCERCQSEEKSCKLNRSPFAYEGNAVNLIYALKFKRRKYLANTLGAFMADTFLKRHMDADIAVFVPMTGQERKKRKYNQSELLAIDVAQRLNMPLLPALVKKKSTSEQKALSAQDRAKNLEGAFECVFAQVKGRKILLIDDVYTTGATSNECAKALLKAGAKEVSVLTAAVTKQKKSFEEKIDLSSEGSSCIIEGARDTAPEVRKDRSKSRSNRISKDGKTPS